MTLPDDLDAAMREIEAEKKARTLSRRRKLVALALLVGGNGIAYIVSGTVYCAPPGGAGEMTCSPLVWRPSWALFQVFVNLVVIGCAYSESSDV